MSARNSLGPTSHASDNSSLPLPTPPALSAHSPLTTVLGNYSPKEHEGSSSSYLDPPPTRPRKGNTRIGSSSSERDEDDRGPKLPSRAAHSDVTISHVEDNLDARSSAAPRPSPVTNFFRRTVHRVRRPPSELDTGLGTTRNGVQKGDDVDVRHKRPQLALPVVFDPKQEADFGIFQKRSIMDNLEERLEFAKKLHREVFDLQTYYGSGTVAAMDDIRTTGNAVFRRLTRL